MTPQIQYISTNFYYCCRDKIHGVVVSFEFARKSPGDSIAINQDERRRGRAASADNKHVRQGDSWRLPKKSSRLRPSEYRPEGRPKKVWPEGRFRVGFGKSSGTESRKLPVSVSESPKLNTQSKQTLPPPATAVGAANTTSTPTKSRAAHDGNAMVKRRAVPIWSRGRVLRQAAGRG